MVDKKSKSKALVIRGSQIAEDSHGHIRLDDIWVAAKAKPSKEPSRWRDTAGAKALITELQKKIVISGLKENRPDIPVIYALRGRGRSGTFAHPILAAAYAGYLSPKLELEVREVWLRFRSGDATLADEVLERASDQDNLWVARRAESRVMRNIYTDTLKRHGVTGRGYGDCTDEGYLGLFGNRTDKLRREMGLPAKTNVRNHLSRINLSQVILMEDLAAEGIEAEDSRGNSECKEVTGRMARHVRAAVEAARSGRQK
jgi:hypothetical protein